MSRRPGTYVRARVPGHRTMVYCDDSAVPLWGFWCLDCPDARRPYTESRNALDKLASRHSAATANRRVVDQATTRG